MGAGFLQFWTLTPAMRVEGGGLEGGRGFLRLLACFLKIPTFLNSHK